MLSRKHYRVIASIINDSTINNVPPLLIDKDDLINALCVMFAHDNSLFSRDRFVNACNGD